MTDTPFDAPSQSRPDGSVPPGATLGVRQTPRGQSLGTKFFVLGLLVALLSIPIFFVWLLTMDRQSNHDAAVREIGRQWGGPQTVVGPLLAVPVTILIETQESEGRTVQRRVPRVLTIAPDTLTIDGALAPERRHLGIHEATVYQAGLTAQASYTRPALDGVSETIVNVDWDRARLVVSITDLKGIEQVTATRDGRDIGTAQPGLGPNADTTLPGFHLPIDLGDGFTNGDEPLTIALDIALKGSQTISLAPVGRQTEATLSSSWPHPGFRGEFLPADRTIAEDGFEAQWSVPQLARAIPSLVVSDERRMLLAFNAAAFGVDLHQPVDFYRFVDRAVKYGVLFVGAAFLVIFTIEVMSKGRMHLVHYMMTGLMMIVFYVLLLALAEIVGFAVAYAIAAGATGAVIAGFVASVFAGRVWTISAFGGFALLYGALYMVLSLRDAALLAGAIAAFIVLSAMMFGTRNVDWSLRAGSRMEQKES